jgi:hypothetical protein
MIEWLAMSMHSRRVPLEINTSRNATMHTYAPSVSCRCECLTPTELCYCSRPGPNDRLAAVVERLTFGRGDSLLEGTVALTAVIRAGPDEQVLAAHPMTGPPSSSVAHGRFEA